MTQPQAKPERERGAPGIVIKPARFRAPAASAPRAPLRIHWAPLVIGSVLLLWAAGAWFLLSARSVTIKATPDLAAINVEEWLAPRLGNHWLLLPGARAVRVTAPGYITFAGELIVGDDQIQTHAVDLERLPGHLAITLKPAVKAQVSVDGVEHGSAPGTVADIPAGQREIEIKAPRYRSHTTQLEVEGKGITQDLAVVLEPAWADFHINSKPGGATISIDGKRAGTTPYDSELLEGRRVVQLTHEGYKTWQQTLTVVAGTAVQLATVVMNKADGRLEVNSTPAGASVTVDGEFVGRTPLKIAVAPDKAHAVRLVQEGFTPTEQQVSVASGRHEVLNLTLAAELASIQLTTMPADAELLIDGELRGSATQTLSLPTHAHELTVRREGYATYQVTVTPRKGVEKRFRIRLKTLAEAAAGGDRGAPRTRTDGGGRRGPATSFAGQVMKLFTGGPVVIGSSGRDRARRSDEVQRQVLLERPFYVSVKEVTNAQFRLFLANHHASAFKDKNLDDDEQPAAGMSWATAALYCNWLSRHDGLPAFYQIKYGEVLGVNPDATGYRLPTEAEWEFAARSAPGSEATLYAWGDTYPPRGRSGNYADASAATLVTGALLGYSDGFTVAAPVGSFNPNLNELYDMGGNVAEWVHDYYDAAPEQAPSRDPLGPTGGTLHVIKGASWAQASATQLRLTSRDSGDEGRNDVGFRLARYAQ